MNEDMSEMINNFSKMMNNQQMPDNIRNILNSMGNSSGTDNKTTSNPENKSYENGKSRGNSSASKNSNTEHNDNVNENNIFGNMDINTLLKMQKIMSSMNDKQNDSRSNLLLSLKPYLKESRRNKVDQYIQLMKMEKIFEIMNPLGGDNKNV